MSGSRVTAFRCALSEVEMRPTSNTGWTVVAALRHYTRPVWYSAVQYSKVALVPILSVLCPCFSISSGPDIVVGAHEVGLHVRNITVQYNGTTVE